MDFIFILALKAFGDFTIALNIFRRLRVSSGLPSPVIVAGEHLRPLANALAVEQEVRFIGDKTWIDVPAAFDVRKHGKWAAICSLLELRSEIATLDPGSTLLFDQIGWRESLISFGKNSLSLPRDCQNIYVGFTELFTNIGYKIDPFSIGIKRSVPRQAVLIPGSRIESKQIPQHVSSVIKRVLDAHGIRLKAIRLEGEDVELPTDLHTQIIPRKFSVLCASLRQADLVISADSLSAHLAEYFNIPTFVLTPSPNNYWLPFTCFRDSAWANFTMLSPFNVWVEKQFDLCS